jgi:hypothetical protein
MIAGCLAILSDTARASDFKDSRLWVATFVAASTLLTVEASTKRENNIISDSRIAAATAKITAITGISIFDLLPIVDRSFAADYQCSSKLWSGKPKPACEITSQGRILAF